MPELPEVETVVRELKKKLKGASFCGFQVNYSPLVKGDLKKVLRRPIKDIFRKGKYIVFDFSGVYLTVHLRMSGQILIGSANETKKHVHLIMKAKNPSKNIVYRDIRKFGSWEVGRSPKLPLGTDALSGELNLEAIYLAFKKRSASIKELLLRQDLIAGLGNIYASEVLNCAGISPFCKGKELSRKKIKALLGCIKKILAKAVKLKGASFSDYVTPQGEKGGYLKIARVYKRDGENCLNCKEGVIVSRKIAGRATYFCQTCQLCYNKDVKGT